MHAHTYLVLYIRENLQSINQSHIYSEANNLSSTHIITYLGIPANNILPMFSNKDNIVWKTWTTSSPYKSHEEEEGEKSSFIKERTVSDLRLAVAILRHPENDTVSR